MNVLKSTFLFCGLLFGSFIYAQKFDHTISPSDENFISPKASLDDVSWIEGYWRGQAFGGEIEEVWTPPLGGSMSCVFKLVVNDVVNFYEIVTIMEIEETLVLKLKHFNTDLSGWEEKDVTVDFPLVKVEEDRVYFSGFTFERIDKNHMNTYVIIGDGKGNSDEVKFAYTRAPLGPP